MEAKFRGYVGSSGEAKMAAGLSAPFELKLNVFLQTVLFLQINVFSYRRLVYGGNFSCTRASIDNRVVLLRMNLLLTRTLNEFSQYIYLLIYLWIRLSNLGA
jgi:hypothetical protein